MLSELQLAKIESQGLSEESVLLLQEVRRLKKFLAEFNADVDRQLKEIEASMTLLEGENSRLRSVNTSTFFERDACISLLARLASAQGLRAGTCRAQVPEVNREGKEELQTQNRVVVDLPSGQVSWDFLEEDGHLFAELPPYERPLELQSTREIYTRVMNPGIARV